MKKQLQRWIGSSHKAGSAHRSRHNGDPSQRLDRLTGRDKKNVREIKPFSRLALELLEERALMNVAPVVSAGLDQTMLVSPATLDGTVTDDGLPGAGLTTQWSKVSGPGDVTFADPTGVDTNAFFSQPGNYVLRLTANDGALTTTDDVTIKASEGIQLLDPMPVSATTLDKPQSKVWVQDNTWFSAFAGSIWRLDGTAWTKLLKLNIGSGRTDAKVVGDVVHVMALNNATTSTTTNTGVPQLASVSIGSAQYVPGSGGTPGTYIAWPQRSTATTLDLDIDVESATIDVDSSGRMWLEYDTTSDIVVRYSDAPYTTFSAPIVLGSNTSLDDIGSVIALPNGSVGVLWSDQTAARFSFRLHKSGDAPDVWGQDELPGAEAALQIGSGLADDHVNIKAASDNTLYAAIKTSYNQPGEPSMALLVRRPNGVWDPLYNVADHGTRPIVELNEQANKLLYIFPADANSAGADLLYRESPLSRISFGPTGTFMAGGFNDPTSTKQVVNGTMVLMTHTGSTILGALMTFGNSAPTVDAGVDQTVSLTQTATLDATVSDDGLPNPPKRVTTTWSEVSGPGTVTFGSTSSVDTPARFSAAGTYVLRLIADDGDLTTSDDITFSVQQNDPPSVSAGPDQTVPATQTTLNLDGTVSDDGKPNPPGRVSSTWSVVSGPGTVTFDNASAVDTVAHFGMPGTYVLRLTGDDGSISVSDDATITVGINQAPAVNAGADQSIPNNVTATLHGIVTDDGLPNPPQTVTIAWSLLSGPGTVTFTSLNAADTNATFSRTGTYVLRLTASDGAVSTSDDVTINVTPTTTISRVTDSFQDGVSPTTSYTGTQDNWIDSQRPDLNFGTSQSLNIDGTPDYGALIKWDLTSIPPTSAVQSASITLNVTDATIDGYELYEMKRNWSETESTWNRFAGTSTWQTSGGQGSNDKGSTVLGSISNVAKGIVTITLNSDGVALVQRWIDSPSTNLGFLIQDYVNGNDNLVFRSSEASTATERPILNVTYLGTNTAPVADAGPDQAITTNTVATLHGTATDDNRPNPPKKLTPTWSLVSGPGTVTFATPNALDTTATFSAGGQYVLRLTVSDTELLAIDDVMITVNQIPQVNAGLDQTIAANSPATLHGTVSDDGLPIPPGAVTTTWSMFSGPGTVTFANPAALDTSASFSVPGSYILRLSATDGGATSADDVTITVNAPPTVNAGLDQTLITLREASLSGTATDDGLPVPPGAVTTAWSQVSGPGTATFGNPAALATTATFSLPGSYVLRLAASDGVLSAADDVTFTVNAPPTLDAGAEQTVLLSAGAVLNALVNDDGIPNPPGATTAEWSVLSGPGAVTFADPHALHTTASFSQTGVYVLRLTASDGALSEFGDVTINVHTAPTVDAGLDQVALTPSVALDATVTDDGLPNPPGKLTTTWSLVSGPGTVTFGNAAAVDTTATFSAPGSYVLRLTANDGGVTVQDDVAVRVNGAPVVNAGPDQAIMVSSPAVLTGVVTDDGLPIPPGTLTTMWSMVSGPGIATFANPSSPNTTVTFNAKGTYVLRLTATDGALTTSDDVAITTKVSTITVTNSFQDGVLPTAAYAGTRDNWLNSGKTTTNNGTAVTLTVDGKTDSATLLKWDLSSIPVGTVITSASITLNVSDPSTNTYNLYELKRNWTETGSTWTNYASGTKWQSAGVKGSLDRGTTVLGTIAAKVKGVVTVPLNSAGVALVQSWINNPAANFGFVAQNYSATDPMIFASSEAATVSTRPKLDISARIENQAPVVNAGPDQTLIVDPTATLTGTASDDGLPNPPHALTTRWSVVSGPGTVTFADPAALSTTATFSAPGTYVVRLTASDSELSPVDDVTIKVNAPPVVDAGADQTLLASPATLHAVVTDDGLPNPPARVSTTWSTLSGPGTVTFSNPTTVDTSATFSVPGEYVLRMTASDGSFSAADDVTININSPPAVNAGPDRTLPNTLLANLDATVSDDGVPNPPAHVTPAWTTVSGPGTVTIADPASLHTTATFSVPGTYVLRLAASDGSLESVDDITVRVNAAPQVNAGTDQTVFLPAATLHGSAIDDGVPNPPGRLTTTWSQVSGPGVATFGTAAALDTTVSFSIAGIYTLRLTANDGGLSTFDDIVIDSNGAPTVNAGTDQTLLATRSTSLHGTASDDGNPNPPGRLTYAWSLVSGPGTATFGSPTALDTTADFSLPGQYVLRLSANDGAVNGADDVTVTVNGAPVANAGPDATLLTTRSGRLQASVSDDGVGNPANRVSVSWSQVSGPGVVTFDDASLAGATATFPAPGVYVLRLTANDGALAATDEVMVTVNGNPTANAGADQVLLTTTSASLHGTASDDGIPSTLATTWSLVSGPGTVTFGSATSLDTSAAFSAPGSYVLRLQASDGALAATDDLVITVNGAPAVSAGPDQTVLSSLAASVDGTVSDDGVPSTPGRVTTMWTKLSGPGAVTFGDAAAVDTTASFSLAGTYVLRLSATDGALTSTDDVSITLNAAPVVDAGADQTLLTSPATLHGSVTDDGLPTNPGRVTSRWTQVSGPGTVTFGDATALNTTASFLAQGVYVLRLTADDGVLIASDDVTIHINAAPLVNAGDDQVLPTTMATSLHATVSDDGVPNPPGRVTTSWTKLSGPGSVSFGDATAADTTANFGAAGRYVLRLSASDGDLTSSDDVVITVNAAPIVDAGADQLVPEGSTVNLRGTASDDGVPTGSLSRAWSVVVGGGTVTFADALQAETTATFSTPGAYVLRLTANDGALSTSDDVTVTVNALPVVSAGPDQTLVSSSATSLDGTVSDDGLPNPPGRMTTSWTQVSGPGTATFSDSAAVDTAVSFSLAGRYVLRLSANDGASTVSDDIAIAVNATPSVNAGADQTVSGLATLHGIVTDDSLPNPPGRVTTTWSKVTGPGSVTFGDASAVDAQASFSVPGTYVLRLTANDSVLSASDEVTIRVNAAPTVDAGADQVLRDSRLATLDATVSDDGLPESPGRVTTAWTKLSGPGSVTFGDAASVDTTATFSDPGSYVLRLTASDGAYMTSDDIAITVNGAPTVNAGADQFLATSVSTSLAGTVSDDGVPNPPGAPTITWSQVSGLGVATFGNRSAAATTVSFSRPGQYVLRLSASDAALTTSDDVTITVNGAPSVDPGPDQVLLATMSTSLDATVTDDGLPNPPAQFTTLWSQVSGPGTATFGDTAAVDTTVSFSAAGVYVLRLRASDGALSTSEDVIVTINQAPSVNAGADQTLLSTMATSVDGTVSDDGLPNPPGSLTTTWSKVSGPGTASFGDSHLADTTISFSAVGTYVLRLTAFDGAHSTSDDVTVTVNGAPQVSAGADQTIRAGTSASLLGTVSDDGLARATNSSWTKVSGLGAVTFSDAASLNTNASFTTSGVYVLRLTADDGAYSASDDVTVTVNVPPSVNAGPDQTLLATLAANLDGTVSDDGLPESPGRVTTAWTLVSGPGTVSFGNAADVDTSASFSRSGAYVLRLTANDSAHSTSDDVTVTVNGAPQVNAGADQVVLVSRSTSANLDGTISDDGVGSPAGNVTTTWTMISGPAAVTFGNAAAVDTTVSFTTLGTYLLRLTASDGALSTSDDVRILFTDNTAPTVDAGPDQTLLASWATSLHGTYSDDGLPDPTFAFRTQWSQVIGPGTATFGSPTSLDTTVSFSTPGAYVLRLSADDGSLVGDDDVTIIVNAAPSVDAGADQIVSGAATLDGTVGDDGVGTTPGQITTAWSKVSGPGSVTFAEDTAVNTTVTFSALGVYVLRLTASDGALTATDDVTIVENAIPVVHAGPDQLLLSSSAAELRGTVTDDGLPNPPARVTTTWTKVSGPGAVSFGSAAALNTTAGFGAPGVYVLRLTADDGAITASDDLTITVNATPVVNAGADQFLATSVTTNLGGVVTDDGIPNPPAGVTIMWSKVSGPGSVIFGDASTANTTASFSAAGTYVLRLAASDSVLATADDVTISVNGVPTVNAGPDQVLPASTTASLDGTVSDDGLPAALSTTWSRVSGPGIVTFGDASAVDTTVNFSTPGTYVLRLSATDGALTTADEVTIKVNDTPTVNAGPDQILLTTRSTGLHGTTSDDGLPATPGRVSTTWAKVSGSGSVTFGDAAALDTTASFSEPGLYLLRLTGTDGALSASDELTVIINAAPSIDAGADQTLLTASAANLDGAASDDGLPASPGQVATTWTKLSGPGSVSFGDAAALHTTATFGTPGVYVLQLSGSDGSLTTTDAVTITVNAAPAVNAGTDQTLLATSTANLDGTVTDDGVASPTGTLTTTWSKVSGPDGVTFGNPAAVDTTAVFGAPGTYVLRLMATDGALTRSDDITITVNATPTVNAGLDQFLPASMTATLDGFASDDGVPTSPGRLTTTWSKVSGPGSVSFGDGAAVHTTATFGAAGAYVLRLTATDGVLSSADDVTVTVNAAPAVNAGADQTLPTVLATTLHGTVSDDTLPNPPAHVTSTWSQVSGPGTVTFGDASVLDTTVGFSTPGTYVLRLTATDSVLATADDVIVKVNATPVVNAGADQLLLTSSSAVLQGTVSDDGVPVPPGSVTATWTKVSGPGLVTFGNASAANTTATFGAPGSYVLRLTASDGALSGTDDVAITVNGAPAVNAGPDQLITVSVIASLDGTVSDDGLPSSPGSVTTSWTKVSGPGTVTFGDAAAVDTTASFSAAGSYVLRLTASDGALATSDDVVIAVNAAPVINAGADQNLLTSSSTGLHGTVTDEGLPNPPARVTSTWSKLTGPGNVSFGNTAALDTTASFSLPGVYELRLAATDGMLSSTDDLIIVVNATPTVDAGPDQMLLASQATSLHGTTSDDGLPNPPAQVTTTWSKVSGPGTVTFGTASNLDTTASFSLPGRYVLRLTASDAALTATDDLAVTINAAPSVNAGPDFRAILAGVANLDGTVSDDGLPNPPAGVTTTWTQVSGPGTATFGNVSSVDTTATFNAEGSYVLRLTATDGALTTSDDVSILVEANTAPTVNAGSDQFVSGPATLHGVVSDDGVPNPPGSVTTTWSKISGPGTVSFANTASLDTTATFSLPGSYVLRLTANDGSLSASDDVAVTVNAAPSVNAGPDRTVALKSGANLYAIVTDDGLPSPGTVTTLWSKVSGPGTVTFGNASVINTTVTFSLKGTYVLRLTASDGAISTSDDVAITAGEFTVNQAPLVSAGPDLTVTLPGAATLDGTVADDRLPSPPAAVTVTWAKVSGPGSVSFANSSNVDTSATFSTAGTYVLRLTASDGALTASDDVTVTVNTSGASAEPVQPIRPSAADSGELDDYLRLTGVDRVQADLPYHGAGYSVAIIDTGIDYTHPALAGRVILGPDFGSGDADPMDHNGHGTHVAGIVASSDPHAPGIVPEANIVALKITSDDSDSASLESIEQALQWVLDHQAEYHIVAANLSFGGGTVSDGSGPAVIGSLYQQLADRGVFIAVAAGNDYAPGSGEGLNMLAVSPAVASVGAVWDSNVGPAAWVTGARDNSTAADRIMSITARSSSLDLLAPGGDILSLDVGGGLTIRSGTSMAAPFVAATATLLRQVADVQGTPLTPAQTLDLLQRSGVHVLDGDDEDTNVASTGRYYSRVDVAAAVDALRTGYAAMLTAQDIVSDPRVAALNPQSAVLVDAAVAGTTLPVAGIDLLVADDSANPCDSLSTSGRVDLENSASVPDVDEPASAEQIATADSADAASNAGTITREPSDAELFDAVLDCLDTRGLI